MLDHANLEEYADPVEYDVENTLDEEGGFFVRVAERNGGPVLDLACGTGRVTIAGDAATSIQHCEQHRRDRATGAVRRSRIALRWSDEAHTRRQLAAAGLEVVAVHGDWLGGPVRPASRELIYVCERR